MFYKKVAFKNFANFTGKHLCQSLFLKKVAGWVLQLNIEKQTLTHVFFCEFREIFKNTFSGWLPLNVQPCISFPRSRAMLKDSHYFLKEVNIIEKNWKLLTNKVLEKSKLLWFFDFHKVCYITCKLSPWAAMYSCPCSKQGETSPRSCNS